MLLFGMSYICLQIFQLIGISHTHFLSYNPKKAVSSNELTAFFGALEPQRVHVLFILRACNFIRTKAASAYVYFFSSTVYNRPYSLNVRFPSFSCANVRVTHVHTARCGFATYFAKVCHSFHLQA